MTPIDSEAGNLADSERENDGLVNNVFQPSAVIEPVPARLQRCPACNLFFFSWREIYDHDCPGLHVLDDNSNELEHEENDNAAHGLK